MTSHFVKAVLRSPWVAQLMLESKLIQIPAISYFPGRAGGLGGWVEEIKIKTNSV